MILSRAVDREHTLRYLEMNIFLAAERNNLFPVHKESIHFPRFVKNQLLSGKNNTVLIVFQVFLVTILQL
ncbi:MAG: hypothetical protein UW84_C0042G0008 [Candidatus Collierbacteria bacterium GW2011_GWA2_44_99]|uniref:Uncharacterized protein n=1 Tax=Candidatus Collierbacteria bacterium GW2011_GWA2_44_99 TaxID=1618380 RepID=A0A0G1KNM6_9BACT|nr:MAG: hypothetical protein UW84_C0042G0008 [Candidatus Collierbacteria bacterium GW2011_GWA2_44_99]